MIARLDEGFQNSKRFVADASHDLRTPLTILRGELVTGFIGLGLCSVQHADQVIVLKEGRVVERGTCADLTRSSVVFNELFHDQRVQREATGDLTGAKP